MAIDNKDLSFLLETAIVAARLAGQKAMEEMNFVKSYRKTDTEIVTEADARCQQIIIDTVKQNYSDHGFVAEEGGKDNKLFKQAPRSDNDFWWTIDPIDGTNNFSQKILNFCVSIAVINQGRPVVGVIFEPATDSMFTAAGNGPPQFNGTRISAKENDFNVFETIGIESLFSEGVPDWIIHLLRTLRCRSLGTAAMHLSYVAKGSFVAAVMEAPKLWDIAAGSFLVQSAGGIVSDWQGKTIWPVDMQKYNGETFKTLASNKTVHKKLVDLINKKV